jgi:hypothetical protein
VKKKKKTSNFGLGEVPTLALAMVVSPTNSAITKPKKLARIKRLCHRKFLVLVVGIAYEPRKTLMKIMFVRK